MSGYRKIDVLLISLIVLDVTLSTAAFCCPRFWFTIFHGAEYVDPQGLLPRMAANWAAFALLQIIAYRKWKAQPHWLAVIAGVRLSDMFTDWTYLYFCQDITPFGRIGLFAMSPANVLIGWYLLRAYTKPLNNLRGTASTFLASGKE